MFQFYKRCFILLNSDNFNLNDLNQAIKQDALIKTLDPKMKKALGLKDIVNQMKTTNK